MKERKDARPENIQLYPLLNEVVWNIRYARRAMTGAFISLFIMCFGAWNASKSTLNQQKLGWFTFVYFFLIVALYCFDYAFYKAKWHTAMSTREFKIFKIVIIVLFIFALISFIISLFTG